MLKDIAISYYQQGYNCAESILRAGNDVYQLGLHDKDMIMVAAFGGGLQIGDLCGALSSAACVISSRYVETKAHDYKELQAITQQLVLAFQKQMGARQCAQIKPNFFTPQLRCQNTVANAADILQEVIFRWEKEKMTTH